MQTALMALFSMYAFHNYMPVNNMTDDYNNKFWPLGQCQWRKKLQKTK